MGALDRLLADTLASIIREKLGDVTCKKVEARLKERYDQTLVNSVKDFYNLDSTLREFFGAGADSLEEDFLEQLISINTSAKGRKLITIENVDLAQLILESYGNREKRLILDSALRQPNVILEILETCNIPKSSGYRIINELVEAGLLTEAGYTETTDGKKVNMYTSLFEKVKIDIDKGILVQVLLKENVLDESQILKVLLRKR